MDIYININDDPRDNWEAEWYQDLRACGEDEGLVPLGLPYDWMPPQLIVLGTHWFVLEIPLTDPRHPCFLGRTREFPGPPVRP